MDQGIIEAMKKNYKKIFFRRMLFNEKSANITQFLKSWTLLDTVYTVASAWENVSKITISKCWSTLLGNQSLQVKQPHDDLTALLNSRNSQTYSNEDVSEWLQNDQNLETCKYPTDQEIIERVFSATNKVCLKLTLSKRRFF